MVKLIEKMAEMEDIILFTKKGKLVQSLDTDIRHFIKALGGSDDFILMPEIIVDYGCGDGHIGTILAKMFSKSLIIMLADDVPSAKTAELNIEKNKLQNAKILLQDIAKIDYRPDMVIMRVSGYEGRTRLEHKIQKALEALAGKGQLIIICHKKKGAASLMKMIPEAFLPVEIMSKSGGYRIFRLHKKTRNSSFVKKTPSPEKIIDYRLNGKEYKFETEPGLFSKDHIDEATQLLLENIKVKNAVQILDLGTGCGVIGVVLADRFLKAQVIMADVDRQAVDVASRNTILNGVEKNTRVVFCDDLLTVSEKKFDLIVSNFPLHIPYNEKLGLIHGCYRILNPGGRFYVTIVRVAQYDLRPVMKKIFGNIVTVVENGREGQGFRVSYSEKNV